MPTNMDTHIDTDTLTNPMLDIVSRIDGCPLLKMKIKCKFWKKCPLYDKESVVCNRDGGMYYAWDRPAGCYRELQEKEDENKKSP